MKSLIYKGEENDLIPYETCFIVCPSLKVIRGKAFFHCSLMTVLLGEGLEEIGEEAFG